VEKFALVTGETTTRGVVVLTSAPWFGGTRTGSGMHQRREERRFTSVVISST